MIILNSATISNFYPIYNNNSNKIKNQNSRKLRKIHYFFFISVLLIRIPAVGVATTGGRGVLEVSVRKPTKIQTTGANFFIKSYLQQLLIFKNVLWHAINLSLSYLDVNDLNPAPVCLLMCSLE